MHTYVIAEAGSCHDGDFQQARALVRAAADAGADAIKYQYWSAPDALADRRAVPHEYREIYRRYRVPLAWLPQLRDAAQALGLDFVCTTYLPQDVEWVAPYARHFKVASFEAAAHDLLAAHAPFIDRDRWLIVSVGMGADFFSLGSFPPEKAHAVKLLLCTSAYPAPPESLNLKRLWNDLRLLPDDPLDGLSDHSDPRMTWTGALAVAASASIIEAHLRLDATDPKNPDAPHAMNQQQFTEYVRHIRFAETCLGDGIRKRHAIEEPMSRYRVVR